MSARSSREIGETPLTLDELVSIARGETAPAISATALERIEASAKAFERRHDEGRDIYGVTTSVGASVDTAVERRDAKRFALNLVRMHGVGSGPELDPVETRAVMTARLASIAVGLSGLRSEVAQLLLELIRRGVTPCIPSRGSVGASGDLTPLSYVAAVLVGEREALFEGERLPAAEALTRAGLAPLSLGPKESLVLMNGTAMSTALACLAAHRAEAIARLAARLTAAASLAVAGNPEHFDARLHAAKPHPGQSRVAAWIREDLAGGAGGPVARLQDRYSIRCAPHVVGVLCDAARHAREILEIELNGVSDNPIVAGDDILHGGNFYGGHLAHACDTLKIAVANVACLLDRQIMLLCHPQENAGLPRDLVGVTGPDAAAHNGFKAASIAASSLAADALKTSAPASVFSRSTELHNQDKVPMAPLAARDLLAIVDATEAVAGLATLAVCQALDLAEVRPGPALADFHDRVRRVAPRLVEDRPLDGDQIAVRALIAEGALAPRASMRDDATRSEVAPR